MSSIETMSHVELLDHAFAHVMSGEYHPDARCCDDSRAEVLRRMDSARTSSRGEIEPDKDGYQR